MYFGTFDIVLNFGFGPIWNYLNILGHSIISQSLGEIIISESFRIDKVIFRNSEIGHICKVS